MITSLILIVAALAGPEAPNSQDPTPLDPADDKRVDRPIRHDFDGEGLTFEQDKPRVDHYAEAMKGNQSLRAYIVAYAGLVSYKNEARIRLRCIRDYLKPLTVFPPPV